jgi:hypothetical protein
VGLRHGEFGGFGRKVYPNEVKTLHVLQEIEDAVIYQVNG